MSIIASNIELSAEGGERTSEAGFIHLNGIDYVSYKVFSMRAPVKCKSRLTGPVFAAKNPEAGAVYARFNKDSRKWVKREGNNKRLDKIFLKKAFAENVPEFMREVGGGGDAAAPIIDDSGVESAPDIIVVAEEDKFRDINGDIIEVETRGARIADKVFFSVKDIIKAFGMKNLLTTVIDKRKGGGGFCFNIHYKYMNCKTTRENGTIKVKKELFLTYMGFLKLIFVSRTKFTDGTRNNNVYVMKKWIDNFDATVLNEYVIDTSDIDEDGPEGYVYLVSSPLLNAVKIGMWRGTVDALRARYATCYGADLSLKLFYTRDARALEGTTHAHFDHIRLSNELFAKEHIALYGDFIEKHIDPPTALRAPADESDSDSEEEEEEYNL
jgi:hypothetical protein